MPSTTFHNLPAEKQERLLAAARAEFIRVPYEDASINQIVRAARIPRGSFYMYFDGKEDLFRYLIESYSTLLEKQMGELLDQSGGDLFAAFLALFDHILECREDGKYREAAEILRLNHQMKTGVFLDRKGPEAILDRLRDRIDLSRLDLRTDTDLADLFHLLVSAVAGMMVTSASGDPTQLRVRLARIFGILQRGAAPKSDSLERERP